MLIRSILFSARSVLVKTEFVPLVLIVFFRINVTRISEDKQALCYWYKQSLVKRYTLFNS